MSCRTYARDNGYSTVHSGTSHLQPPPPILLPATRVPERIYLAIGTAVKQWGGDLQDIQYSPNTGSRQDACLSLDDVDTNSPTIGNARGQ